VTPFRRIGAKELGRRGRGEKDPRGKLEGLAATVLEGKGKERLGGNAKTKIKTHQAVDLPQ